MQREIGDLNNWGTSRGASTGALQTNTVAGATNGVETTNGLGSEVEFYISDPLAADVTISGTITINVWAAESASGANVAINARIFRLQPDGTLTEIAKSTRTTEVAVTTRAVNNFTVTPTSTAMKAGDRLAMVYFGDDAGTGMNSGFTFNHSAGSASGGVDGDTFITFTEDMTFLTSDPSGTQLFLTDTAGRMSARTSRRNSDDTRCRCYEHRQQPPVGRPRFSGQIRAALPSSGTPSSSPPSRSVVSSTSTFERNRHPK
jgi:hypothetical protein